METRALHDLWSYLHAHLEFSWEETNTTTYLMDLFQHVGL